MALAGFVLTLISICLTPALSFASALDQNLEQSQSRVFNGEDVAAGEIPWQVSIQIYTGFHWCGGSIIDAKHILTAAHCSEGWNIISLRVVAGTINTDAPGSVHTVNQITNHEDYDNVTYANDIAIWQISDTFTWDNQTAPVDLPDQGLETPAGTILTFSGFKSVSSNPEPLQKIEIPVIAKNVCNETFSGFEGYDGVNQICAGVPEEGLSSCQGDEGGPLFLGTEIRGIASWGSNCGFQDSPGVYIEVSAFRDWIFQNSGVWFTK